MALCDAMLGSTLPAEAHCDGTLGSAMLESLSVAEPVPMVLRVATLEPIPLAEDHCDLALSKAKLEGGCAVESVLMTLRGAMLGPTPLGEAHCDGTRGSAMLDSISPLDGPADIVCDLVLREA